MTLVWQYFLLIVICAILITECVKFRCDYWYTDIGWFKYHEMPMAWHDARLQCHLEGAALASPITKEMRYYMMQSFRKPQIFTGIHALLTPGQYHSVEGVPLAKIAHEWAPTQPDNLNNAERCLSLHFNGLFSDVSCDQPQSFICFRPHSDKDVNVCGTPDPEYQFESKTNKCYKFHTSPRTFKRANFACQAEGGYLVIINSEDEAQVIRNIWLKYPPSKMIGPFMKDLAHVGMYNWDESEDWTTIHGEWLKDAGYDKFYPGEPNNSTTGEYCGGVFPNGLFNDLRCESHYAFICEKDPNYPPVCDSENQESLLKNSDNLMEKSFNISIDP